MRWVARGRRWRPLDLCFSHATTLIRMDPSSLPVGTDNSWAEEFFARGWHDGHAWVVLERVPCSARRFREIVSATLRKDSSGWALGTCSYRVLYAPTFMGFASTQTQLRIVEAIRDYPAQRGASFESVERPAWEASGVPEALLSKLSDQAKSRPTRDTFRWPLLVVAANPSNGKYVLLGSVATLDILLPALATRRDIDIDRGLALLLLYTCHGSPGEFKWDTAINGTPVARFTYQKSAFTAPFHFRRFNQVRAALLRQGATDSALERRDQLLRLLAEFLPSAVESVRVNPPRAGSRIHSLVRGRLAQRVSSALQLVAWKEKSRRPRQRWWTQIDDLTPREVRRFLATLSPHERKALTDVRRGARSRANPSTPRVHLCRAKTKFHKFLRERSE